MKVRVLGSGIVGRVLGSGFVNHEHQVNDGHARSNDKEVREWLAQTPGASAGSFADAAQFAEVIVLVVLGRIVDKLIDLAWLAAFAGRWIRGARFRRCSAGVPTRALPRDSISSPGRDPEGAGGDTRVQRPFHAPSGTTSQPGPRRPLASSLTAPQACRCPGRKTPRDRPSARSGRYTTRCAVAARRGRSVG